ncbi:ribosomal RNA large subunit methyltransferase k/l like protein [Babesia gibsoni]|uniref:Ribosomal RNA large subunit methyltransferase k/l like protein n=1 Tax=Babesia gibsoni TaxID=33632 RepID=A0AAD8UWH0_BABGI|nr:ribosomal RNA large subunit methyltransferase k/l like protein [Babesia gibsoni]
MVRQWLSTHRILVKCVRGLEGTLERELLSLGFARNCLTKTRSGIIVEDASLRKLYFLSYFTRISSGVYVEAASFPVKDKLSFTDRCAGVEWKQFLKPDSSFVVKGSISESTCFLHSGLYASQLVKDGISHFFGRHLGNPSPTVSLRDPSIKVHVNIDHGEAKILVDAVGTPTSNRPYRYKPALDDMNPAVAAALLHDVGFASHQENPFSIQQYEDMCEAKDYGCQSNDLEETKRCFTSTPDPASRPKPKTLVSLFSCCGTFLIEAAMYAARVAPGLLHSDFDFTKFSAYDDVSFKKLVDYANYIRIPVNSDEYNVLERKFIGVESNWEKVEASLYSADKAGVMGLVHIIQSDYMKDGLYDACRSKLEGDQWAYLIAHLPKLKQRFGSIPDNSAYHESDDISHFPDSADTNKPYHATTRGTATLKNHRKVALDPCRYYRLASNISKFRNRFFEEDTRCLLVVPTVVDIQSLSDSCCSDLRGGKHFMSGGIPCTAYVTRNANEAQS